MRVFKTLFLSLIICLTIFGFSSCGNTTSSLQYVLQGTLKENQGQSLWLELIEKDEDDRSLLYDDSTHIKLVKRYDRDLGFPATKVYLNGKRASVKDLQVGDTLSVIYTAYDLCMTVTHPNGDMTPDYEHYALIISARR